MNHAEAIVGILVGVWAIWNGLTAEAEFYALGPAQKRTPKTKRIPNWIGRPWFVLVGAFILYSAVPELRGAWHWSDVKGAWWIVVFFGVVWALKWVVGKLENSDPPNDVQPLGLDRNR